jgi:hypothetical protein
MLMMSMMILKYDPRNADKVSESDRNLEIALTLPSPISIYYTVPLPPLPPPSLDD